MQKLGLSKLSKQLLSSPNAYRILFYLSWVFINLLQAWMTELFDDEAYYWVCSRFLDWGYFDHPPMIALLIRLGTIFLPSEIGVRIFPVLLTTFSIYLLEKLVDPKNKLLFYCIILNILILQLGGILAVPDIPLFFFTVLFFLAYKRLIQSAGLVQILLLAVIIALLIYSKYHGLLVVFFTLLSNLKLFNKRSSYLVALFSMILLIPHFIWQFNHGYPSIQYQLFERVSPPYRLNFTTDFILGQLLVAGPLAGWLIIWSALKNKPFTDVDRAMYFSIIGFYALFFLSSFFTRTELNWTIPILVPLVSLSYHYLSYDKIKARWLYWITPFTLAIALVIRIFMVVDFYPVKSIPKDEFHQNKTWAAEIKRQAAGLPVVFTNSYQRASKYWFYSGDTSFSLNTFRYRRNGYNFWPIEHWLQQKKIVLIGSEQADFMPQTFTTPRMNHSFIKIDSFHSNSQVAIIGASLIVEKNNLVKCTLKIEYPMSYLEFAPKTNSKIVLMINPLNKSKPTLVETPYLINGRNDQLKFKLRLPNLPDQQYTIRWGLTNSFAEPTINSRAYKLSNSNISQ